MLTPREYDGPRTRPRVGSAPQLGRPIGQSLLAAECQRLNDAPEVCVVLGGGHTPAGDASEATLRRAETAARLATGKPHLPFILSGGHASVDGPIPLRSEAALMAERLQQHGVEPSHVYLEDQSRNTIGNAVLSATRYLCSLSPRPILLVSCGFHLPRATLIFSRVLGPAWQIRPVPALGGAQGALVALREAERLASALAFFSGIAPGDLQTIEARFSERFAPLPGVGTVAGAATAA